MKPLVTLLSAALLTLATATAVADPITDAVANEHREMKDRLRDEYRNPQQTLRFFGIEPNMTVVEIWPGGGWYTDILAPMLKENGKLIAAHFHVTENSPKYYSRYLNQFKDKIANHPPYADIELTAFDAVLAPDLAKPGSADAVLTFRNVHNWYMQKGEESLNKAFAAFFKALKPGGILGVVDHQLPESADDVTMEKSGYIKKSLVVDAAEAAGFTLAAESDVNANPMDTADHPRGVWSLPPSMAMGEENKDKYLAIGESNRMTLKFVKPKN
ncbi:class I SAM-dependent methyltransferase [Alteromonas ponticola]|uniref:Class I SAM-dependent methyltransferase n=1 Tax=Alteromonas ponticola TaxID=2720613 RepID=A0ABX1R2V6_9ALTE|nr:class I SAM-dependent methyltransferase [Alteromonas ponticola]NMH60800.1 class I SAM-dependent methyltransferase [Alteromonas ponticola]